MIAGRPIASGETLEPGLGSLSWKTLIDGRPIASGGPGKMQRSMGMKWKGPIGGVADGDGRVLQSQFKV